MKRDFFVVLMMSVSLMACLNNTDKEYFKRKKAPDSAVATMPSPPPAAPVDSTKITSITWIDSAKNMGTVNEGDVVKISYRFRNSGTRPLVIKQVQPACGCTVAEYPKEPIAPGKEGEIKAEFNSAGRPGAQRKNINVFANTAEQSTTLYFSVMVNKKS